MRLSRFCMLSTTVGLLALAPACGGSSSKAAVTTGSGTPPTYEVSNLAGVALVSGSVNGPGSGASFNHPGGVAVDALGNVYVADTSNSDIRAITH